MVRVLGLFCSNNTQPPKSATEFDKETLRLKYEAIIADFGRKSSLILATNVVNECSSKNIKSLLRMTGPTISNAKSSPGTKINAIQLVTVMATSHDYYAKLVSKSGILKHVYSLARLKNGEPISRYFVNYSQEEVYACIIYARRTIGMLADLSYYKNVTDDVVPNGIQCLIHVANRIKSTLMTQGICFSGDMWTYERSRSNSVVVNNITSDIELVPMKSLGTKLKELEYHISLLQDEIAQTGVLDGNSKSRDYTRIADIKSRLDFCHQQAQLNLDAALDTGDEMYCNDLLELLSSIKALLDACSSALPASDTNLHQQQYQFANGGDEDHTVATFDTTISSTRSINNSGVVVSSVHSNSDDNFERANMSSIATSSLCIVPTESIESQIQIQVEEEEGDDNYNDSRHESTGSDAAVWNDSTDSSINEKVEGNVFVADFGEQGDNIIAAPFTEQDKDTSKDKDVNTGGFAPEPSAHVNISATSDHWKHSDGLETPSQSPSGFNVKDEEPAPAPSLSSAGHCKPSNTGAAASADREKVFKENQDIVEMLFEDLRLNADPIDSGNVSQVAKISAFDSNVPLKSPDHSSTAGTDWGDLFNHKNNTVKNEHSGWLQKVEPCSEHKNANATDQVPTAKQEDVEEDDWLNFCSDDDNINANHDDKSEGGKDSVDDLSKIHLANGPVADADNDSPRTTLEMIRNYNKSTSTQDQVTKPPICDDIGIPNTPMEILNSAHSNGTNAVAMNGTSQLLAAPEGASLTAPAPLDSGPRYSNSDTVKNALVLSHGTLYRDSYVKVDFSLDRRVHERPMRIECSLEICNIGTRRFEHVQYNLTDFEHFPIHLVLGSEQLGTANKALAPKRTLCLSFDLYCLTPYMGMPKVSITLFIDGGKRRHLDLYLPIAMSRFAFPAACLHLSERLVTLPHKIYACIRGPRTHEIIEKARLGGVFAAVDTGTQEYWYSCSFLECSDTSGTLTPISEHFVLAQIEPLIEYDAATISVYSDSYRLANALTQLYKYLFHQQQKQCE